MNNRSDLENGDDPFLVVTATGIMRELGGDEAADRFRRSPPSRERLIEFILRNQR